MITGQWGTNATPLLDIRVGDDGTVTGIANPGRERAPIRSGRFDAATGALRLEGEHTEPGRPPIPFVIEGKLDGGKLALRYQFGEQTGELTMGRVEEYHPKPLTIRQRLEPYLAAVQRRLNARTRPTGADNARKLNERGESLDSIVFRDASADDIAALAELHVTTWNATYNTTRGPTVEIRAWQWTEVFRKNDPRSFVLVLENASGRLIGFAWGKPHGGMDGFAGQLSKIYLRWEYHGLGLGRRMMGHIARRFLERGIDSFILFAELSNPTLGFYDRMGGERLLDEHGRFGGAYGWRDVSALAERCPPE
jgi:L-amino acid N-acyltransferase YncA